MDHNSSCDSSRYSFTYINAFTIYAFVTALQIENASTFASYIHARDGALMVIFMEHEQ